VVHRSGRTAAATHSIQQSTWHPWHPWHPWVPWLLWLQCRVMWAMHRVIARRKMIVRLKPRIQQRQLIAKQWWSPCSRWDRHHTCSCQQIQAGKKTEKNILVYSHIYKLSRFLFTFYLHLYTWMFPHLMASPVMLKQRCNPSRSARPVVSIHRAVLSPNSDWDWDQFARCHAIKAPGALALWLTWAVKPFPFRSPFQQRPGHLANPWVIFVQEIGQIWRFCTSQSWDGHCSGTL
jgi:hypothetical protein